MIKIERLIIDNKFENHYFTNEIIKRLGINPEYKNKIELINEISSLERKKIFDSSKKILFITENKGKFLKKCPGSKGVVCCNYYTINSITGCPFDCSYCILQHYIFNNPFITIFLNREKIIHEISIFLEKYNYLRVGTGELTDSLALDHIINETGFFLENIMKNNWFNKITFEFKTKSNNVENLIENYKKYPGCDIVLGVSVNIPEIIQKEEYYTNTLEERVNAAKLCADNGINIAIHFDPIIMLEKYINDYKEIIDYIFKTIPNSKIRWISMGGLRFNHSLYPIIKERNPDSILLVGELFHTDQDNKYRYISYIRSNFYKILINKLYEVFPNAPLYLCMEKRFIWNKLYKNPLNYRRNYVKEVFDKIK